MAEAVLQGPNGQPAIDALTGMPLTMEELLRRRGIVPMGNMVSMLGANGTAQASAAQAAQGGSNAATALANRATGGSGSNTVNAGNGSSGSPLPSVEAATGQATPTSEEEAASLLPYLLGAAGAAGLGTGAYMMMRGRNIANGSDTAQGTGPGFTRTVDGGEAVNNTPSAAGPLAKRNQQLYGTVEDAEFYPVQDQVAGPREQKRISNSTQADIASGNNTLEQQKKLPENSRRAAARAIAKRGQTATPTDIGTIAGQAPINVVSEAGDASLARTLGIPEATLNVLKKNPGLLNTLKRIR